MGRGDAAGDHALGVERGLEPVLRVVGEGHAAGHAGREVEADGSQDHRHAAGHIFQAVGADALDHGDSA
jgi:hypothetical protein